MVGFTMVCVALWPRAVGFTMAPCGRCGVCVAGRVCEKRGGPVAGPPCGVQAAVSYSPTPWRVQYHRRWQS